jgi:signal peptidase I
LDGTRLSLECETDAQKMLRTVSRATKQELKEANRLGIFFDGTIITMSRKEASLIGLYLIAAIALGLFIRSFVAGIYQVDGPSMLPAFRDGDFVFVSRIFRELKPGDIIVFRAPGNPKLRLIKRIISTQESNIEVSDFKLLIDGKPGMDPAQAQWDRDAFECRFSPRLHNERGNLFVMGDNRCRSMDSREFGGISRDSVEGKVLWDLHWPRLVFIGKSAKNNNL